MVDKCLRGILYGPRYAGVLTRMRGQQTMADLRAMVDMDSLGPELTEMRQSVAVRPINND